MLSDEDFSTWTTISIIESGYSTNVELEVSAEFTESETGFKEMR